MHEAGQHAGPDNIKDHSFLACERRMPCSYKEVLQRAQGNDECGIGRIIGRIGFAVKQGGRENAK
jgi:hypothetical protein